MTDNKSLSYLQEDRYGIYPGVYRAVVVDNNDPEKLARLKVRVFDLYRDLEEQDLPWAEASFKDGGEDNVGHVFIPRIGATVLIAFEQGNENKPFWLGCVYGSPGKKSEVPAVFKGEATDPAASDTEPLINEPAFWQAQYPHNKGVRTSNGIVIEYDDTEGQERIHLYHPSGSHMEFRNNGDVVLHVFGNYHLVVDGNVEELYKQNHNQVVEQNQTETVTLNKTTTILGTETKTVTLAAIHNYLNTLTQTVSLAAILTYLQAYTKTVTGIGVETYNNVYNKTVVGAATEIYQGTLTRTAAFDVVDTYATRYTLTVTDDIRITSVSGDIDIENPITPTGRIRITSNPVAGQIRLSAGGQTNVIP